MKSVVLLLLLLFATNEVAVGIRSVLRFVKPLAPVLAWYALALSPIYGNSEFEGKAAGLGSMTNFRELNNRNGPTVESNEYIVAPRGYCKYARVVESPQYKLSAERLYDVVDQTIRKQPLITFIKADKDTLRLQYVQRTPIFQFPDVITVQTIPDSDKDSTIAMHSYSIYGGGDLGTNKKRVKSFLVEIQKAVEQSLR